MRENGVLLRAERLILNKRRKDDSTRKCTEKVLNSNIDKSCFTKWNCTRKSYWFQEKNKSPRKVLKNFSSSSRNGSLN